MTDPGILLLRTDHLDAMVEHARRDHPVEACGVIVGPAGSDCPARLIPMANAAVSESFYEFASADLLRLYRQMEAADEEPTVIYHSHTSTPARPSATDIALAAEPGAHYVVMSTRRHGRSPGPVEVRAFRIRDGSACEAEIHVVGRTGSITSWPAAP